MLPQAFSGQLVGADRSVTAHPRAKTVAIEHFETVYFPPSPICDFCPETDRYARHAEIQIRQLGELFAVAVAPLDYHSPSATAFLGDRINL
jgi:hypothetical protein